MNCMVERPFSESCVENREPIMAVLGPRLAGCRSLLEIGSGTGQHAVYFGSELGQLRWQTSDRDENHPGISAWLAVAGLANVLPPLALDVLLDPWPAEPYDAVFSANTAHIMSTAAVAAMFAGVGRVLAPGGPFLLYGPFCYHGRHTAASNARFHEWLEARDPAMGVRDVAWLTELAASAGLVLAEDLEMPVNNRTLVWRKASQDGHAI
jgi:cyclopropane fatty-acyl-phospholipid synthase-like methyltransferase